MCFAITHQCLSIMLSGFGGNSRPWTKRWYQEDLSKAVWEQERCTHPRFRRWNWNNWWLREYSEYSKKTCPWMLQVLSREGWSVQFNSINVYFTMLSLSLSQVWGFTPGAMWDYAQHPLSAGNYFPSEAVPPCGGYFEHLPADTVQRHCTTVAWNICMVALLPWCVHWQL